MTNGAHIHEALGGGALNRKRCWSRVVVTTAAAALVGGAALGLTGCNPTVEVKPIRVEPIEVTLNINIKIDRQLDDFFDFENKGNGKNGKTTPAKDNGAGNSGARKDGGA